MDEKDFFNRDTMYWREVNATSPGMIAEIELIEQLEIEGEWVGKIVGGLLPFESNEVVYEMENGGAFKKNEVITWPFVPLKSLEFYKDESNPEVDRKAKLLMISHAKIQSITLTDDKGNVVLNKTKI